MNEKLEWPDIFIYVLAFVAALGAMWFMIILVFGWPEEIIECPPETHKSLVTYDTGDVGVVCRRYINGFFGGTEVLDQMFGNGNWEIKLKKN